MTKILLVEDEALVREPLTDQLRKNSFDVVAVSTLAQAREAMKKDISLVILDWELPDGQGVDLLREWRNASIQVPTIFLTARTDITDKIVGLEMGADDYMTKPFDIKELIARIRVRLRQSVKAPSSSIKLGDLEINFENRTVQVHGKPVELAKMEFDLLKFFVENRNRALARDEILNKVWGFENFPTSRTVDTHVLILRQKIGGSYFETLRGVGYRFKVTE